jgi:protein-S-isoprenylcysteine O-methyltransferase Ste14
MTPSLLFRLAWGLWALSWLAAALWTAPTVKRSAAGARWLHLVIILAGILLLFGKTSAWLQAVRLWHVGYGGAWVLALLTIPGFLFAWWARLHLGRLWSGAVTRKEGHYVVDSGPYAIVRHPIYTGLLGATLATALAEATLPALCGFALIALGLWLKARLEEEFLRQELGREAYDFYRRRVPMLVPFGPKGTRPNSA